MMLYYVWGQIIDADRIARDTAGSENTGAALSYLDPNLTGTVAT